MKEKKSFTPQAGYTFEDLLLKPGFNDSIAPDKCNTRSRFSRNVPLRSPFASAAMDTVTESSMAISLALAGGIGIIHKGRDMDPKNQAIEVQKVKRFMSDWIQHPITVQQGMSVAKTLSVMQDQGVNTIPVLDDGILVGAVQKAILQLCDKRKIPISQVMTKRENLPIFDHYDIDKAKKLFLDSGQKKLFLVNNLHEMLLIGLVTLTDFVKKRANPLANLDRNGQLIVGAAVSTDPKDYEVRVPELIKANVNVLVVDSAHGHSQYVSHTISWIKRKYPEIDVVAGNIATADGARYLLEAGCDGIKVGIGPGRICTTREKIGVGVPQLTAIWDVVQYCHFRGVNIPIIADGGINTPGDVHKALAAGASCIMAGGIFAGTDEAPGEKFERDGRYYKRYRGMGSAQAMRDAQTVRYFTKKVAEGVDGEVPYKGPVKNILEEYHNALISAFQYFGVMDIEDLHLYGQNINNWILQTPAGQQESGIRIQKTK